MGNRPPLPPICNRWPPLPPICNLAVAQSDKGVFITTSDFTKGAYEYVASLNSTAKIVLINGEKLAEYIYDYNLGMQIENVIEIKKLDSDFWDLMLDDK